MARLISCLCSDSVCLFCLGRKMVGTLDPPACPRISSVDNVVAYSAARHVHNVGMGDELDNALCKQRERGEITPGATHLAQLSVGFRATADVVPNRSSNVAALSTATEVVALLQHLTHPAPFRAKQGTMCTKTILSPSGHIDYGDGAGAQQLIEVHNIRLGGLAGAGTIPWLSCLGRSQGSGCNGFLQPV